MLELPKGLSCLFNAGQVAASLFCRFHYQTHQHLREHLSAFVTAYSFTKGLKTLRGLSPYECIVKTWAESAQHFRCDPKHYNMRMHSFSSEDWAGLHRLIPEEQIFTDKDLSLPIEQDKSGIRHYKARLRRRSKVLSQSETMVNLSLRLHQQLKIPENHSALVTLFRALFEGTLSTKGKRSDHILHAMNALGSGDERDLIYPICRYILRMRQG